jgi:hypothetical protein
VETSSLWHYMFKSVVRMSGQGGSGHCVMLCRVSEPAAYMVHLYQNMSQLRVQHSYVTNNVHLVGIIN